MLKQILSDLSGSMESRDESVCSSTACAYVKPSAVPPHPGPRWTRFVCISDNHSWTRVALPPGDVLVHAGDLSSWGYPTQLMVTLDWLAGLDYPIKIIIAGNHDLCLDENLPEADMELDKEALSAIRAYMRGIEMKKANIHYLEHQSMEFTTASGRKWTVYGSPAAPKYAAGAFQYVEREEAQAIYDKIPSETEILLTHTPAYGCLDYTKRQKHAGCKVLRDKLESLGACRLHVFGHIHESSGAELKITQEGVRVDVNAAVAKTGTAVVVDLLN